MRALAAIAVALLVCLQLAVIFAFFAALLLRA